MTRQQVIPGILALWFLGPLAYTQDHQSQQQMGHPQSELALQVREIRSKASLILSRIQRKKSVVEKRAAEATKLVDLRDWMTGQKWKFTTTITSISAEDKQVYLNANCPFELAKYSQNRDALQRGGLFAHSVRIVIPTAEKGKFSAGDEVVLTGTTHALLDDDVPVREVGAPCLILLDLIMPAIGRSAPRRIELSLESITLKSDKQSIVLPSRVVLSDPSPTARDPDLESSLLEIEALAQECIEEAQRQKNTAMISEVLAEYRKRMKTSLSGRKWTFQVKAVDVMGTAGKYTLTLACHKSLAKFANNTLAESRGGIRSYEHQILVDREVADSIGRGDAVTMEGTVVAAEDNDLARGLPHEALTLFSVFLPPFDNRPPQKVSVQLTQISLR